MTLHRSFPLLPLLCAEKGIRLLKGDIVTALEGQDGKVVLPTVLCSLSCIAHVRALPLHSSFAHVTSGCNASCRPGGFRRTHGPSRQCLPSPGLQVTTAVLKSGTKLDCSLVLVGTGARPNTDLFQGQLDLVEGPPGGIVVNGQLQVRAPPPLSPPTSPHPHTPPTRSDHVGWLGAV